VDDTKGGSIGRMCMHDAIDIMPSPQKECMQRRLNRWMPFALNNFAVFIYNHDILRREQLVISTAGRNTNKTTLRITCTQISLSGMHQLAIVHLFGVPCDFSA